MTPITDAEYNDLEEPQDIENVSINLRLIPPGMFFEINLYIIL